MKMNGTINTTRIIFTGDISFSGYFREGCYKNGCLSDEVKAYLQSADHVIANVESPITDCSIDSDRELNHKSPTKAGKYLADHNINIWNLANNHIMDCGEEGLRDTIECAVQNGCRTIGAGMDLEQAGKEIVLGKDVKIGVFSVVRPWEFLKCDANHCGAFTWNRKELIKEKIKDMRKISDWVVIIVHGGDEYCGFPMPYIRERYVEYLKWGADIVVAHHPHVVQNYEIVGNKCIFYSLGNFIFDTDNQRGYQHTDVGELLGISFTKGDFSYDHLTTKVDRNANQVAATSATPIFQNISSDEYRRLWPLAANEYYFINKRRRFGLHPKLTKMPKGRFLLNEMKNLIHKRERIILKGRILSLIGVWKGSKRKDVVQYLNSGIS